MPHWHHCRRLSVQVHDAATAAYRLFGTSMRLVSQLAKPVLLGGRRPKTKRVPWVAWVRDEISEDPSSLHALCNENCGQ